MLLTKGDVVYSSRNCCVTNSASKIKSVTSVFGLAKLKSIFRMFVFEYRTNAARRIRQKMGTCWLVAFRISTAHLESYTPSGMVILNSRIAHKCGVVF